jgi:hypothetical protein
VKKGMVNSYTVERWRIWLLWSSWLGTTSNKR